MREDVHCDICGRRLRTAASRRAGRGVVCARKTVTRALTALRVHYQRTTIRPAASEQQLALFEQELT